MIVVGGPPSQPIKIDISKLTFINNAYIVRFDWLSRRTQVVSSNVVRSVVVSFFTHFNF